MAAMTWNFFLVLGVASSGYGATTGAGYCSWNLNTELPTNEPIYLQIKNGQSELIIPKDSQGLQLSRNEEMVLFCPGSKNEIASSGSAEATVRCAQGQNVLLGLKSMDLEELHCKKSSSGDGFVTDESCGTGGHIVKLGYNTTHGWVNLINACYSEEKAAALYSEHTIYGAGMAGSSKQSLRPSFHTFGVPKEIHPAQAYAQKGQTKALSQILDKDLVSKMMKGAGSFLARGHLAPDADFLYGAWQFTTYYYVNAVPQWQQVNAGNWKRLEGYVRKISEDLGHDVRVLTGSYGVSTMPGPSGEDVPLYLAADNRLPVPKWTWKIIQSEDTKKGIAFLSLNNPFATAIDDSELPCKDICKSANWHHDDWSNFGKGYTVCCRVEELVKKLGDIPRIKTSGILKGNL